MVEEITQAVLGQLDELSVQMVVGGAGAPETFEALAAIEKSTREAGSALLADAARELQAQARGAAKTSQEAFEQVITAGIENLRKALEPAQTPDKAAPPAPAALALAQDAELMGDFVNEAGEHLATIEAQILILEREPTAGDPLNAAFRGFHTIKGLAGFLDLGDIRAVSHEVETVLDKARNQQLLLTPAIIDVVLESADYLKRAIACVQSGLLGTAAEAPAYDGLLERVRAVLEGRQAAGNASIPERAEAPKPAEKAKTVETAKSDGETAFSLRVDAGKLDYMMDMVGELVIAQSLITHNPEIGALESGPLQRNLQQLGRITAEVQRVAMSMRMTPVSTLFGRMNRLVRDLTRKNGKKVRLELSGEETELDKTIIEQLADPLMHMVRNSLDHGLEGPEDRVAAGKSAEGRLLLSASHQAGHILIEITDDGRGLNTEKILKKARERGLVSEGQNLSDNEIFFLIFEPGFSTAETVTDVSGRGVGMDVVRRQIQGLRGRIEIQSVRGKGATFLMRLPLTLAIIDGLIVGVGEERYIMPINSVREMLRPTAEMIFTVEGRAEMAMVRGELLPIVRLNLRLGIEGARQNPWEALFVVVEAQGRRFCLLVDEMLGKQEVVIKNLGDTFRHVSGISGGAILGDGRVGLILDVNGVLRDKRMPKIGPAVDSSPALGASEFEKFRRLAYDKCGLNLTEAKHELVAARLGKKLRELKIPSYRAYYDHVVADATGESLIALIDALSTNHTSFLREASHFDFLLTRALPALRKRSSIDIWSAPCSTGEEPYSIAVTLLEQLGTPPKPALRIRATDISTKALAIAKKGAYTAEKLGAMPMALIRKYFTQSGPGSFQICAEVRRMIEFERFNLIEPMRANRAFPIIFCRNVMIYFDKPTQERVVATLSQFLEPGGYLMIGHSESLMGVRHGLEYVQPAIYKKPGDLA